MSDAPDRIWTRDLDGTGSQHPCWPGDDGATEYMRADLAPDPALFAEVVEALRVAENMICAALPLNENTMSSQAFGLAHARDKLRATLAAAPRGPWLMFTKDGFYPIQPSPLCKPEDHGNLNDHVIRIEDVAGNVLWRRVTQ